MAKLDEWLEKQEKLCEEATGGLYEKLAEAEHNQWWDWSIDIASKEKLSKERIEHWETNCWKPYKELTEQLKDLDRREVERIWPHIEKFIVSLPQALKIIRKIKEALEFYEKGSHLWAESEQAPPGVNVGETIGHYARQALKDIEEVLQ